MLDINSDNIIDSIMNDLDVVKRKTQGQDRSKNYHKITISVNQKDKESLQSYAQSKGVSVSEVLKALLREKAII